MKIKTVWINNGIASQKIVSGLSIITLPLNEKSKTKVKSNAVVLTGVSHCKNLSLNKSIPLCFMIHILDR